LYYKSNERNKTPVILFVGNLIYRKGIDLLAKACGILKNRKVNFKLRLLGGGEQSWAEEEFKKNDLLDLIEYGGFCEGEKLREEYSKADLFVLPSRHDTYGVVTYEAAASSLPLVISKNAGSSEVLVNEGFNGFIIDPFNSELFADRLEELLKNQELRNLFGERSKKIASEWSVEVMNIKVTNFILNFIK
jgi:glycosyltransferase involved in cell wall biosynthesis